MFVIGNVALADTANFFAPVFLLVIIYLSDLGSFLVLEYLRDFDGRMYFNSSYGFYDECNLPDLSSCV